MHHESERRERQRPVEVAACRSLINVASRRVGLRGVPPRGERARSASESPSSTRAQHARRERRADAAAVAAFSATNAIAIVRMVGGRVAHEQRVDLAVRVLRACRSCRPPRCPVTRADVRGARVHDALHRLVHGRPVFGVGVEPGLDRAFSMRNSGTPSMALHDVRTERVAAIRDDRRHQCQLQRRDEQLALSDAQVEQYAARPVPALEVAVVVVRRRHQPARLAGQVDARALTQPEIAGAFDCRWSSPSLRPSW